MDRKPGNTWGRRVGQDLAAKDSTTRLSSRLVCEITFSDSYYCNYD